MRRRSPVAVPFLAVASLLLGASGAHAEETCRLASLSGPEAALYQHKEGADVLLKRCSARRDLEAWSQADAGVGQGVFDCGAVRVCGKKWRRVRIGGSGFLVTPRDVRVVELPGERDDVPALPAVETAGTSCWEVAVGPQGADLYLSDPTRGPRAVVSGAERLSPGEVLGACADVGDLLAVHAGKKTGVVPAEQVASTCQTRDIGYFLEPGPFCRRPVWPATTRRPVQIYGGDGPSGGSHVPADEGMLVTGVLQGAGARHAWAVVGYAGDRGLVPLEALTLGDEVEQIEPALPESSCPASSRLVFTTCDATFQPTGRATGDAPLPGPFPISNGRALLAHGDILQFADLLGTLKQTECLYRPTGDKAARSLRFSMQGVAKSVQTDSCSGDVVATRAPSLLGATWRSHVADALLELPYLMRTIPKGDSLLVVAPGLFPQPSPRLADLAFASLVGASSRVVKALVLGADAVRTPLQRRLDAAFRGPRVARGLALDPPPVVEDTEELLAQALPGAATGAHDALDAALALSGETLTVPARELALDAIGLLEPDDPRSGEALALYAHTARLAGPGPRAIALLLPWCTARRPDSREACRLGAQAALEDDHIDKATPFVQHLLEEGPQTARQHATVASWQAARGAAAAAAAAYANAAASARAECPECSELTASIGIQIARAALAAEDPDAAHDVLQRLPAPLLVANLEVVLQTLASTGRYDEAFEVMQSVRWGLAGERPRPSLLLWGSHVLERSCRYDAAVALQTLLTQQLETLRRVYDALPGRTEAPDPGPLFGRLERVLASPEVASVVQSSALQRVLRCGETCSRWNVTRHQLERFDALLTEQGLSLDDRLRRGLAFTLDRDSRACMTSYKAARQRLKEDIDDLERQLGFLEVDRDNHLGEELRLASQILDRVESLSRERLATDRAAAEPAWARARVELPPVFGALPEALNGELAGACARPARVDGEDIEGHRLIDAEVQRAARCLTAAADADLSPAGLRLLARYLPALTIARRSDFAEGVIPLAIADLVPASEDPTGRDEACCVATRPRLAELMAR